MNASDTYALAVHAGAGNDIPGEAPPGTEDERRSALLAALREGEAILQAGRTAVDAVVHAVVALEDCPLFNAGKGSVLAADGTVEMDASVMDGATGRAGGVSTVTTLRNPVLAAQAILRHSPHAILCGPGAETFAAAHGLAREDNAWFRTPHRIDQLRRAKERGAGQERESTGTVGAVARDRLGNLAAATSTGGMTNKALGRVSDSSIPGAGVWARNGIVAVSCTGTGDDFIRNATAYEIEALVAHRGRGLAEACNEALQRIAAQAGNGGVIAVDAGGAIAAVRAADHMAWASVREGEDPASGLGSAGPVRYETGAGA
ncbi:MAG: isoaspartyl peptidase/L-asparaginase [Alphaproteobacteria bacterium]|nr:isoaspartyl peptidase/L-asparaginase [Alphaproteobacteria bacterium]